MLIDRGHLREEGDRWHLAGGAELPVPDSVQGLIAARLDDLSADEKALVQDAAVLGKVLWLGALAMMSGTDRFVVEERLQGLERREMLRRERRSSVGGETEYAFRHVLTRDVAYSQIPRAQRARKHRQAAEWIETLSADRENAPELLAYHYSQALEFARDCGQPTDDLERRTRLAFRDAAERSSALNSFASATRYYLAALDLWPEDDPDWPSLVVAATDIGGLNVGGGHYMTDALRKARNRLEGSGDLATAAKAELLAAFQLWTAANTESNAAFARAAELIGRARPSPTAARVISQIAIHTMVHGQFDETIELCERALAIADQFELEDLRPHVLNTRGCARVSHGDAGGIVDLEESIEIFERLNSAEGMIRGYKNFASTLVDLGELRRATQLHQRGFEIAQRFDADVQIAWFDAELAVDAHWAGDWDFTVAAADRLDEWIAQTGLHYMQAAAHSCRAKVRSARGDAAQADADFKSALSFARRSGEPQMILPTLADAAIIAATTAGVDAPRQVADLVDELASIAKPDTAGGGWTATTALALALTGQSQRLAATSIAGASRWHQAARLITQGSYRQAADRLATIGAAPEEALARLLAAQALINQGRGTDAKTELRPATEFWNSAEATQYRTLADAALRAAGSGYT